MDAPTLLLDTCAVIWIVEDQPIAPGAAKVIDGAASTGQPVLVSPITAWERALLLARGRISSPYSAKDWFDTFATRPEVGLAPFNADILINSVSLPEPLHRDPADRILIATARAHALTIVTRDRHILDYASKGHVRALEC